MPRRGSVFGSAPLWKLLGSENVFNRLMGSCQANFQTFSQCSALKAHVCTCVCPCTSFFPPQGCICITYDNLKLPGETSGVFKHGLGCGNLLSPRLTARKKSTITTLEKTRRRVGGVLRKHICLLLCKRIIARYIRNE